ncbi:unnamed protein product, partial [Staurois parvus]
MSCQSAPAHEYIAGAEVDVHVSWMIMHCAVLIIPV